MPHLSTFPFVHPCPWPYAVRWHPVHRPGTQWRHKVAKVWRESWSFPNGCCYTDSAKCNPRKLTYPPEKMIGWKAIFLLKWSLFNGHVLILGSRSRVSRSKTWWKLPGLSAPAFRELCKASPNSISSAATVLDLGVNPHQRVSSICNMLYMILRWWELERWN